MKNVFLDLFGQSANMRIFDYFLDLPWDANLTDVIEGSGVSKVKAIEVIKLFISKGILIQTRKMGKIKMYGLNGGNIIAKYMQKINKTLLKEQEKLIKNGSK